MDVLRQWLGLEVDEVSLKEKAVAAVGGALGLAAVLLVTHRMLGLDGAPMIVASMGASAVLLFAVPHGQLSQPWPLIAGNLVSAVIGVTCARWIGPVELAAAVAVGTAIFVMHLLRCIHPPGGATALTAVVGGSAVADLGYGYVLRPVAVNVLVILVIAVAYNALWPWRRYPARRTVVAPRSPEALSRERLHAALRRMDLFVDVTDDDLLRLHDLLSEDLPTDGRPEGGRR
jgi:CBS-domain-containing membrane protein